MQGNEAWQKLKIPKQKMIHYAIVIKKCMLNFLKRKKQHTLFVLFGWKSFSLLNMNFSFCQDDRAAAYPDEAVFAFCV